LSFDIRAKGYRKNQGGLASQAIKHKNKKNFFEEVSIQSRLEKELEKVKKLTGLGNDLSVIWSPNKDLDKHGEVKDNIIYVYDEDINSALKTLKHEFIHYHLKYIIEPLIKHINMQKCLIEDLVYRRVEELSDRLSKLL
jgi:thermostable 8-oxoguanine DNA glycosylase